jgi:hypothetical protein
MASDHDEMMARVPFFKGAGAEVYPGDGRPEGFGEEKKAH